MNNGFTFFRSYYEVSATLSEKDRHILYDSILNFIFAEKEPNLTGVLAQLFIVIRPNLENSKNKSVAGAGTGKKAPEKAATKAPEKAEEKSTKKTEMLMERRGVEGKEEKKEKEITAKKESAIKSNTKTTAKEESGQLEWFEYFWMAYPKKKSKGDAEKWWDKNKPDWPLLEKMMAAITKLKTTSQWQKDNGDFIPHPASWLNSKGWEDEIAIQDSPSDKMVY